MLSDESIVLNKVAQDIIPMDEAIQWFESRPLVEQKELLNLLRFFLDQSHPTEETLKMAIQNLSIKQTATPVVLFKTYPYNIAIQKVVELPDYELRESFITLLTIFRYSDTERRHTRCKNECDHEWHNLERRTKRYFFDLNAIIRLFRKTMRTIRLKKAMRSRS